MLQAIEKLMQEGKWKEASFAIDVRLQIQPMIGMLHAYKGLCHYRESEFELAEVCFMRGYVLDPSISEAAVKRAQCLYQLKRYREANDVVNEWSPIIPNNRTLQGIQEFLSYQYGAQEHDAWEKTRSANLHIESGVKD